MRFMLQVRADKDTEAGVMPSRELVTAMGKFNETMIKSGVMLAGEGLHPSSNGARVSFALGRPKLIEPPFAAPNELIAGFWIIDVESKDKAIEWAVRAPFEDGLIEIRQVFEASDFPADILPSEEAAREEFWRKEQQRNTTPRSG